MVLSTLDSCWGSLFTMALNAIRYWVDLKNALKSSGKLHGDVDPSSKGFKALQVIL